MTMLPYERRVWLATQAVMRARTYYDLWWYYEGVDTRQDIIDDMRRYNEFFRFDTHAHFVSMVVYLAAVFEPKKTRNVNLESLIGEAERHRVPEVAIRDARARMKTVEDVRQGVKTLRDKLFAHRDASLDYETAFQQANIQPDDFKRLTEVGLKIGNVLSRHVGGQEQWFSHLPLKHVKQLLEDVKRLGTSLASGRDTGRIT